MEIVLDPTDLIRLDPQTNIRRALWAARFRGLPTQEAFDALLLAAYYTPNVPPHELEKISDSALALELERIQWNLLTPLAGLADQLMRSGDAPLEPEQLVPAWNKAMGPHLGTLKGMALQNLGVLMSKTSHPAFDQMAQETEFNDQGAAENGAMVKAAEQLALNAMARMSAFIRSGHFATFIALGGAPVAQFNHDQFVQLIHQSVLPFVVLDPRLARNTGEFDEPDDDGKPNLILEGWTAEHFRDSEQVSVSLTKKEERMGSLTATMSVIEQGGYPLKPGQKLATHGVDMHIMPLF